MEILEGIILGIIQGLLEWLPISSSGHIVITSWFLGPAWVDNADAVEVWLHAGSLLALLIARFDFWSKAAHQFFTGHWHLDECRLAILSVIGTIPLMLTAFYLLPVVNAVVGLPLVLAILFAASGVVLIFGERASVSGKGMPAGAIEAIWVGLSQSASILPGISRSGFTIAAALAMDINRKEAVELSLALAVPALAGSLILGLTRFHYALSPEIVAGAIASAVVGFVGIRALEWVAIRAKLKWFGAYNILVAVAIAVASFI